MARLLVGVAVAGAALTVLLSQGTTLSQAHRQIGHVRPGLLALAILVELGSLVAFATLQGLLLASGRVTVGMSRLLAVTLGGNALQNSLPAGAAWSSVFAFRSFRRFGADDVLAGWVVVVEGFLVLATVGVAGAAGLASSTPQSAPVIAAVAAGAVALAVAAAVWWRADGSDSAERSRARAIQQRVRAVSPSTRDWLLAEGLAVANLAADCGCLALAFEAVHQPVPWTGLVTAYAVGQLASRLPITPGGLGLVEGGIAAALAAYGLPARATVGAVILYRLISYWGVTLAGWVAIASLTRWSRPAAEARP